MINETIHESSIDSISCRTNPSARRVMLEALLKDLLPFHANVIVMHGVVKPLTALYPSIFISVYVSLPC